MTKRKKKLHWRSRNDTVNRLAVFVFEISRVNNGVWCSLWLSTGLLAPKFGSEIFKCLNNLLEIKYLSDMMMMTFVIFRVYTVYTASIEIERNRKRKASRSVLSLQKWHQK